MLKSTIRICIVCLSILCSALFSDKLVAQPRCTSDEKMEAHFDRDPEFKRAHLIAEKKKNQPKTQKRSQQAVITIPVHVIIVHPPGQSVGTGDNLSLTRIMSQIDVLNEDFRKLNSDSDQTPNEFPTADCMIEFCLASFDENGNDTDGVTRYPTNDNFDANEFTIKAATGWDRDFYMNVWVAPTIDGLGYAYLPTPSSLPNATLDGLAILTGTFGGPGEADLPPYDLGRTATHETGHYLGLRHMWGNGGCSSDDNINDTPTSTEEYYGCPNHPSPSCGTNDMFMNYMDYVNDACMFAYTPGQSDVMNNILNTSRSSLLTAADEKCSGSIPELSGEIQAQSDASCFGFNDGSVTVSGLDGVPPYEYSLDGGNYTPNNTFLNLSAGSYIITIRDDAGQTYDLFVTIGEPDLLQIIEINHSDISCFGEMDGSITVIGVGGNTNQPYQYSIDGGNYGFNNVFLNLASGIHTLSVKDGNDCTASINIFINEPAELFISVEEEDIEHVSCFASNDGSAIVSVNGGTAPYTIVLDGTTPVNGTTVENLEAGDHSLTIVDNNGCSAGTNFTISQPDSLYANLTGKTNLKCHSDASGVISLEGIGGTQGYTYKLEDNEFQEDSSFTGLAAGPHMFTIKDSKGCEASLTETLTEPDEISLTMTDSSEPNCFNDTNGSITISANGGTGDYTYSLNADSNNDGVFDFLAAGSYNFIATDENNCLGTLATDLDQPDEIIVGIANQTEAGCDGLAIGTVQLQATGGTGAYTYLLDGIQNNNGFFDELVSGNYPANVSDLNGCLGSINVDIVEPNNFDFDIVTLDHVLCFGEAEGSVSVIAAGNNQTFEYSIDGVNYSSSNDFTNLAAGEYTLYAKDANNCKQEIMIEVFQPDELYIDVISYSDIICFDDPFGYIDVDYHGGIEPYVITLNGAVVQQSDNLDMIPTGSNELSLRDANGCIFNVQFMVTRAPELGVSLQMVQEIPCGGGAIGEVKLNATGGVEPYTYYFDEIPSNDGNYQMVSPGNHQVAIFDALNCTISQDFLVSEGTDLGIEEMAAGHVRCFGENNGSFAITALGGDGNYSYALVGGPTNTTGLFENLAPALYDLNISDGGNCTTSLMFEITEPDELLIIDTEIKDDTGSANGSIEVIAEGGTFPYMYSVDGSNFDSSNFIENIAQGDYTIIVRDANGCESSQNFSVGLSSSIENLEFISSLTLFPNPVQDELYLEINSEKSHEISLTVRSIEGKVYVSIQSMLNNGNNLIEIEHANLPAGLYLLEISNNIGSTQMKFIKQD